MDASEASTSRSKDEYTIIRIKRKRSEDVPDVLVVDNKGIKKRKSTLNVFQFAETIDEVAWKEIQQDELRKRISALSKSIPKAAETSPEDAGPSNPDALSRQRSTQSNASVRQYRVIPQGAQQERRSSRFYPMPPKVLSSKDLEQARSKIRIYDAELALPESKTELDPEMEKFQELLEDYLKVHDDPPEQSDDKANLPDLLSSTSGDYVYDIFYQRPSTLSDHAIAENMATLTGLPPGFDEDDEYDSESEIEDEADEDSNAEDYYRNDYPDEESPESRSEGSDYYSDDGSEESSRFEPDY